MVKYCAVLFMQLHAERVGLPLIIFVILILSASHRENALVAAPRLLTDCEMSALNSLQRVIPVCLICFRNKGFLRMYRRTVLALLCVGHRVVDASIDDLASIWACYSIVIIGKHSLKGHSTPKPNWRIKNFNDKNDNITNNSNPLDKA